jgi:hypothetical protein
MAKFKIVRKYDLSWIGEDWKECYLEFNALSYEELFSLVGTVVDASDPEAVKIGVEKTTKLLKTKFISGKGIGESGEKVDIAKDDLTDLPPDVINRVVTWLLGELSPKV